MHTILGAGGPVANILARELLSNNHPVRLVSRRPVIQFSDATWQKADLKNFNELSLATKGSSVIYLCAGLKYDKEIWAAEWPLIIENVIRVSQQNNARLIFFDNVYMYGLVNGQMTESTPYNPVSKKGEIRARVATRLMEEIKAGNLRGGIARAADFYGAESLNSIFDSMVLVKYAKKQKALWMGNEKTFHSFTYVPDAGKAMAVLGLRHDSDGAIWHLPTAPALKGTDFIQLAADNFHLKPRFTTVNKLMLLTMGLFNPLIRETVEMYYQYSHHYRFDSTKFENTFEVQPTTYQAGISQFGARLLEKQ